MVFSWQKCSYECKRIRPHLCIWTNSCWCIVRTSYINLSHMCILYWILCKACKQRTPSCPYAHSVPLTTRLHKNTLIRNHYGTSVNRIKCMWSHCAHKIGIYASIASHSIRAWVIHFHYCCNGNSTMLNELDCKTFNVVKCSTVYSPIHQKYG